MGVFRRRIGAAVVGALVAAHTAAAAGYGPLPGYSGPKFPASAAAFAVLPTSRFADSSPVVLSYFLDTTGDRAADVADAATLNLAEFNLTSVLGAYLSPSDPNVVYALVRPQSGPFAVHTFRRSGDRWVRIGSVAFQSDLAELAGNINTPASRAGESGFIHLVALRRRGGRDVVLAIGTRAAMGSSTFTSRFALLEDGPDADVFADTWSDFVEIPDVEAISLDARGGVLARRIASPQSPFNTSAFLRVVDGNGDGLPDQIDPSSIASVPSTTIAYGSYGFGDVDLGADRLLAGPYAQVNLDSRGRPIASSVRSLISRSCSSGCGIPFNPFQLWAGRDGYPVGFAQYVPFGAPDSDGATIFDDLNFDGVTNDYYSSNPIEVLPVVLDADLPDPQMRNVSVAELAELSMPSGSTTASFSDFGTYPNGELFSFRFGGQARTSVWISRRGVVSFLGPVTESASLSGLERSPGAIAAAWSDDWDTSAVQVVAGYAPASSSFVDGARVLAVTIEWRGLRLPSWEPGRAASCRLVLYADGTFRTDFGAMGSGELGGHHFVVGYSGPGNHDLSGLVDASAHTWGAPPAGSRMERVLAEEFDASKPSDLDHVWVRWVGYPERLDAAGPTPELRNPKLKDGRKVTTGAAGSNIESGAVLIVDGVETFTLKLNARGTKWVVGPKARSSPGARSVRTIWSDGQAHLVVVRNPDGETSQPASLP